MSTRMWSGLSGDGTLPPTFTLIVTDCPVVLVGFADGFGGPGAHGGLHRRVHRRVVLRFDVTDHTVLGIVDRLLDLHGGVKRIDAAAERPNDCEVSRRGGGGNEPGEPQLP